MSKETINVILDHFKPKAAAGYGWRNNSEKYMKLHFTIEVLDKDGNEVVNKKFRGYSTYPYKYQVEIDRITEELESFMVEEVRSTMNEALFTRVCKTITKELIKACDKSGVGYWDGDWSELHSMSPIAEIPLKDIYLTSYLPKYQKKIIKLILKDKLLFSDKEVGKKVISCDVKAGYKWIESGAITQDEFIDIIDKDNSRVFSKAEAKLLLDKGLDKDTRLSKKFTDKDNFDIKSISENLDILKDIGEGSISALIECFKTVPKGSNIEDKSKILNYILRTDSWLGKRKNLLPSKEWKGVIKTFYNADVDFENFGFPIKQSLFDVNSSIAVGRFSKEVLDINSPIVDIFTDLWIEAFTSITGLKRRIFIPMIYGESPINRRMIEKAINVRSLHMSMQEYYEYIEKMDLVDAYENVVFTTEVIKNSNPKTTKEKAKFMMSMLDPIYWSNNSDYENTGEIDKFYELIKECKSDKELAGEVSYKLLSAFYTGFPAKSNLNISKIDLLSDLHVSLDFETGISSSLLASHYFIYLYKGSHPLALSCWEKLIDMPNAYCNFKRKQDTLKEYAPHLYEKFLKLAPPKPKPYEEFYDGGQLKESGFKVCEKTIDVKTYHENGQMKSDGTSSWHENGQIKSDGKNHFYDNGQIKSEKTDITDEKKYSEIEYFKDGSIKIKRTVAGGVSTSTVYLKTGEKILHFHMDRNIRKHTGEYSHWYKNGKIWDVKTYDDNGAPIKRITYDEQGDVIFTADYSNGEACNQSGIDQDIPYGDALFGLIPSIDKASTWVNGIKHGTEITYTYDGDFSKGHVLVDSSAYEYKHGVKEEIQTYTEFHKSGNLAFKGEFLNNERHGLCTWWYENGKKQAESNFKDDKEEGLTTWWHENGKKSSEANFKDGERHGTRTIWDKESNVIFLATYNNGESNDQNGLEPQYDDEVNLTHYIEYKDGVVVNEKVEK